jgi:hypothetical protein
MSLKRVTGVLCSLAVVALCCAERGQAKPGAAATANCPAFDAKHLDLDKTIQAELQHMATTLVLNYRVADAKATPDEIARNVGNLKGPLTQFNLALVSSALAASQCLVDSDGATAQAVTAQTANTQTGASSVASGTTSAAQEVGIPQLLAIAVENGAIADSVSGTTMTLSTTPYGFVFAFDRDRDTQERYQDYHFFTQLGLSASFNVASTADPEQSASRKAISQWQAKFTFRDTSPRANTVHKFYSDYLASATSGILMDLTSKQNDLADRMLNDEISLLIDQWSALSPKVVAAVKEKSQNPTEPTAGTAIQALTTEIGQLFDADSTFQSDLAAALKNQQFSGLALHYRKDMTNYQTQYKTFATAVTNLPKGWNGDLAFSQQFPSSTTTSGSTPTKVSPPAYLVSEFDLTCNPKTSDKSAGDAPKTGTGTGGANDALVSAGKQLVACPLGPHVTLTGNFSGSFYTNPNASLHENTYRGVQDALQVQWNLGGGPFSKLKSPDDKSQMTLSFAGNYQRLQENKDQSGKRPDLVTGSVKLSVPISGGASFPIALSFGNATSQVKGNYVVGNFGISFNLDALAALSKLR